MFGIAHFLFHRMNKMNGLVHTLKNLLQEVSGNLHIADIEAYLERLPFYKDIEKKHIYYSLRSIKI